LCCAIANGVCSFIDDILHRHSTNKLLARLDLEHITEVAVLGKDKGFDQLVLPPGHKDMVKSMIRQHFRDKSFIQDDRDQTDVVRGKGIGVHHKNVNYYAHVVLIADAGKGLIMLLHGVPGVGKTSTAGR
jgi:hypothetical protein